MLNFFKIGLPLLVMLAAVGFGSQFVKDYREMATIIAEQNKKISLIETRELSYKNRIDIRDQAIALSSCSKQIQGWVMKPSTLPSPIPQPFTWPPQK
jgi:hypothetical protein